MPSKPPRKEKIMSSVTKNYDVEIQSHHLVDRSTDKLGKLAYVTLSKEFIVYSNDYLVPFHALDIAVVTTSMNRPPKIIGADNVDIWEGSAFDPMAGVSAIDKDGNTVPVTYTGSVDTTVPGDYWLTYTATDSEGNTATTRRRVRVKELEAPHFTGITNINVFQGANIDLTAGVKAWLGSTEITYTYSPTSILPCDVGVHTVTYSATGNGKTTTVDRTITIRQADPPVISGNTPLYVYVNTDFDPLDGLTAVDSNGNPVPVELDDNIFVLTKTVGTTNTQINYIEGTVVPLRKPVLTDRQRFDGWYDNSTMTGTPITEVTITANKQVWCKIAEVEAYASFDSSTGMFRIFVDDAGKYTNEQVIGTVTYYTGIESGVAPWRGALWTESDVLRVQIDDVVHPVDMRGWFKDFRECTQMTGLWRIDTSNCTDMREAFYNTWGLLKTIDISTWDTSKVEQMDYMFYDTNLKKIDISSFSTNALWSTFRMFESSNRIESIYTNAGFNCQTLTQTNDMFKGCTNLVGGAGTVYDANHMDGAYAKVDGGSASPGYFTER